RRHKAGGARVMRLRPRPNLDVNGHWMCDEGRYGYAWHDEGRLPFAAVRREGELTEVSMREAIEAAAAAMRDSEPSEWSVVLSASLSNEDLLLARELFVEGLKIREIHIGPTPPGSQDDLLRRADKNANTAGALALGFRVGDEAALGRIARGTFPRVWAIGYDVIGHLPPDVPRGELATLIFQGSNACATSEAADVILPTATCFETDGTFTNEDERVQRFWRAIDPEGEAEAVHATLQRVGKALGGELTGGDTALIFDALAAREPRWGGMSHESLGDQGAPLAPAQGGES
ncbi:molybdopterin-dependent oxidoreductase, partial [Candidatus Sumerlaeota bacterium]|nr:molybdopterin-dependent oxidoreductase [Candidatus Sumerlaeota bacterium]